MKREIEAIRAKDPSVKHRLEPYLSPGLHAILIHRHVSRPLYRRGHYLAAIFASRIARALTGADIHPGATIGYGGVIDHAMSVVIGETAVLGDGFVLHHEVTLGATGKERGKRHPTVGNGVTIGAGAKIFGNVTVGDGAVIGGNAVVLRNVPPGATAVGNPARIIERVGTILDGSD